jgi:tRNA-2-methylthio-N6-dimethylallyladenosine synthase
MRRGYDREKYLDRLGRLRDRCPEVALSTDIIVGFPGETDEEHRATLEILREIKYDDIFSFMYSPRPQTVAAKVYPDDIPEDVKRARLQTVQMLQGEISLEKNRGLIGTVLPILIEGESKLGKGQVMGRTRTNKIVNLMGLKDLIGKTIPVAITGASANSLMGDTVEARGIA